MHLKYELSEFETVNNFDFDFLRFSKVQKKNNETYCSEMQKNANLQVAEPLCLQNHFKVR